MNKSDKLDLLLADLSSDPKNEELWRHLFRSLYPFVLTAIHRRLRGANLGMAEDLAQEVFFRIVRSNAFREIKNADAFRAFVWIVADNIAKTELKRSRHRAEAAKKVLEFYEYQDLSDPHTAHAAHDALETLKILDKDETALMRLLVEGGSLALKKYRGVAGATGCATGR
jgi:RNA polymerase sigma factor (sigma-70 family)